MSRATFRPCADLPEMAVLIAVLVIDEERRLELRITGTGQISSHPLTQGVEHYRDSPLWEEVKEGS